MAVGLEWSIDRSLSVPPYQQLKQQLKDWIASGQIRENEQLPSNRETALATGASLSTVQRAFNELKREGLIYSLPGRGSFVRASTAKSKRKIVVFIPSAELSFFSEILSGIYAAANSSRFETQVHSLDSSIAWNAKTSELLDRAKDEAAGIIFVEEAFGDLLAKCQEVAAFLPFVAVEWTLENAINIFNDYEKSSFEAIRYLICEKRAQSILVLRGRPQQFNSQRKLLGVQRAVDEFRSGGSFQVHFLDSDFYPQSGYLAVSKFLETDTVDAVFCSNDWQASGVIGALAEKQLLVGRDVALVGFGNYTEKLTAYFPLSTVDQNLRKIGMTAAEAIIRASMGQHVERTIVIETSLIIRKT